MLHKSDKATYLLNKDLQSDKDSFQIDKLKVNKKVNDYDLKDAFVKSSSNLRLLEAQLIELFQRPRPQQLSIVT